MANFEHTKVEPNRLANAAMNIEGSLGMLSNAFRTIEETLIGTLEPSWHGTASEGFFAQYRLDIQTFASHINSLSSVNNRLKEASGIYDRAENTAHDLVANLKL